ncbi:transporter [Nocardioides psychrotolerans]|uniref:ABC-2 type transport system permease protein n=1 Tax=Nocardioides psychrotolerans TaxID=1005945 RepID=A0A1I3JWW3_9ACTN|nr:ABC-2 family transporter protein [Nocardioides psychrotolerans]GEP38334.1 transporter [Nocardioides psychrotolerans]SFI64445.1 ABC-2 type transport system permease protein [Nocardioides psychrotolerans]
MVDAAVAYYRIGSLWVRASMAYPASFWMMAVGSFLMTGLDFVGIWILFGNVDDLGGFSLTEIGFLYGATGLGIAFADLFVGRVERLGQMIRFGRLDTMMTKPVPLLVQVCADEFALRRFARVFQATIVFTWAATYVDWTLPRALVAVEMVVSGSLIFFSLFISLACIQFWTADSSEAANAFTYGGNTVTQFPLTVFPSEIVKALTFVVPIAFVNWYPALFILGREDPFGLPSALQLASPVAAAVMLAVSALVWRTGVRHYRSTGS